MGFFSQAARAVAAGQTVQMTQLVFLDFLTVPMRVHPGFGPVVAGGYSWDGLGGIGSISGLETAMAGTAPEITLVLSGVDSSAVARALASATEVKGRTATVFTQFFDGNLMLLDQPYPVAVLIMDILKIKATGPSTRTVELSAESLWARRSLAPWGYLSDRSQQARFPGDNGLDQVPTLQAKVVDWPVYGS